MSFHEKHLDKILEKWKGEQKSSQNLELRAFELEHTFMNAVIDCLNDMDARLKRIERSFS